MFYDNYVKLCNLVNKSPSAVAEDLGFKKSTVTRWKKGGKPTDATLHKVSEFFNIPIDELLNELHYPITGPTIKHTRRDGSITQTTRMSLGEIPISEFADYLNNKKSADNKSELNENIPKNLIPYAPTGNIPILGTIPAGLAVLAIEDIEGYLTVNVHNPDECFALRVKGDSMINAGISPGDLVVIRMQSCADNGQIVACRVNGDEATLKRFKQQGDTVILLPENPNYEPIIVRCSEFEKGYASIIGVALQVIRML